MKICRVIALIFTTVVLMGCINHKRGIAITKEIRDQYEGIKNAFPEHLTSFFPDNLESGILCYISGEFPKGRYSSHIYVVMEYDSVRVCEIERELRTEAETSGQPHYYTFRDSNLLVLNYYPEDTTHFINLHFNKEREGVVPIPNFDFLEELPPEMQNYADNARIIVLGTGNEPLFQEQFLSKDSAGLSDKWQHGYTRGVTIWDSYVAYWLEVW